MLSAIFSGIKTIFGAGQDGQNNLMKAATGVGKWIDEQQFTDQEKAQFNAELVKHYSAFMENTVKENSQRSRTRRDLAMWIIKTEIFLLLGSAALFKLDAEYAAYLYKIATNSPLDYLVLGVGAFFFGAHLVRTSKGQ